MIARLAVRCRAPATPSILIHLINEELRARLRVAILDGLAEDLAVDVIEARTLERALDEAQRRSPRVIVVGAEDLLHEALRLHQASPAAGVIAVCIGGALPDHELLEHELVMRELDYVQAVMPAREEELIAGLVYAALTAA